MVMNERTFVLKGTICYSNSLTELSITENGYLVCEDGRCAGVFDELPPLMPTFGCDMKSLNLTVWHDDQTNYSVS